MLSDSGLEHVGKAARAAVSLSASSGAATPLVATAPTLINAFDFLYDGLNGCAGLRPNGLAIPAAEIQFTAGFYPNPVPEPGLAWVTLAAAIGLGFAWRRCRIGARSAIAAA